MRVSEGDTGEVLSSWYECNYNAVVGSKAMGEPLPLMLILQVPVPVADKDLCIHIALFLLLSDT